MKEKYSDLKKKNENNLQNEEKFHKMMNKNEELMRKYNILEKNFNEIKGLKTIRITLKLYYYIYYIIKNFVKIKIIKL